MKINYIKMNKYMKNILNYKAEGAKQLKVYKYRINNVKLIWVDQVINLLKYFKIKKINDIGCCYFQFYKGLKNKKKYNYFGYDIEEKFIKLGLKKFPELYKNYKIGDVTRIDLRNCDCSIVSAIIEHVQNPYRLIEKICKSSKKILVVRTYLGIRDEILLKKNSKTPYYFNQLSKDKVKKKFKSFGFNPIIILDEATKFSRTFKIINNTHKRRMYIILAIKNHG